MRIATEETSKTKNDDFLEASIQVEHTIGQGLCDDLSGMPYTFHVKDFMDAWVDLGHMDGACQYLSATTNHVIVTTALT